MSNANDAKIKAAVAARHMFEWKKRRPDLTAAEFDEAVRLHDMRLVLLAGGGYMTANEWIRYQQLWPIHVVKLETGADMRYCLAWTIPNGAAEPHSPQVYKTRWPAQKLADWLCASLAAVFRVKGSSGPVARYSTAFKDDPGLKPQAE